MGNRNTTFWAVINGHPEVIHFICRAEPPGRPASGLFQAVRLATNLPLFPRRLQLPVLVNVRSVRPRLSRTIQGPKSEPESYFGWMCLSPGKQRFTSIWNRSRTWAVKMDVSPTSQALALTRGKLLSQCRVLMSNREGCVQRLNEWSAFYQCGPLESRF